MTILLTECLGNVAPYYNLALVVIAVGLFFKLFSLKNEKLYLAPWRLLFVAVTIFIVEEILTVLNFAGIFYTPRILNAVFEFAIITIFIYMLLIQKEYLKNAK